MPSKNKTTPIEPGKYYHIFNRGNNYENVFYLHDDYIYFLQRYKYHLKLCCESFAYTLMPNHFHFLIRVNENVEYNFFSNQMKLLMQEYTYRINNRFGRSGNLFLKPFRRLEITSDEYFKQLVFYIHYNSLKHKTSENFREYSYSSYKAILASSPTYINREEVLEWFKGKTEFVEFHNFLHNEKQLEKLIFE
ncbi:MAG: transposase [Bacteroidetes bacterium]|nr:transposase [Bacteroidota bacterium]